MTTHTDTDPVCGMQVSEQEAAAKTEYQGETYYFCSQDCKQRFDKNPAQYLRRAAEVLPQQE